jgi:S1-C subfamily serine protease
VTEGEGRAIRKAEEVYVAFADGNQVAARIVGFDPNADVALLKIDPSGLTLRPLRLGTARDLKVGSPVAAIGSPFGEPQSLSVGVVSATDRSIRSLTGFEIAGAIQTDAAINHGNSGGPLLDSAGRVIGINAQIESESGGNDGVGFAIPSSTVRRVASQLISGGQVAHAYLGVQLTDATGGAGVAHVRGDGPAGDAGLEVGDVVTAIDGKPVGTADALVSAVDAHKPGDEVTLKVRRDGRLRDVDVTLGTRPS